MIIFDLFTFKKEALNVFTKENFSLILEKIREEIIKQVKANIPGPEKKVLVDNAVIAAIRNLRENCKNKVVLWVIDEFIKLVPTITQFVYNFLKEKIENL